MGAEEFTADYSDYLGRLVALDNPTDLMGLKPVAGGKRSATPVTGKEKHTLDAAA